MTDFETWMDQCPYNWLRTGLDQDSVTYMFYFPDEEEDEDDEA